jgi:hypothetical protein
LESKIPIYYTSFSIDLTNARKKKPRRRKEEEKKRKKKTDMEEKEG